MPPKLVHVWNHQHQKATTRDYDNLTSPCMDIEISILRFFQLYLWLLEIAALEGSFLRHLWCKKPALWYTSKAACPAYCAWNRLGGIPCILRMIASLLIPRLLERETKIWGYTNHCGVVQCMPTSYWDNDTVYMDLGSCPKWSAEAPPAPFPVGGPQKDVHGKTCQLSSQLSKTPLEAPITPGKFIGIPAMA